MRSLFKFLILFTVPVLMFSGCSKQRKADYPIQPVPFTSVKVTDDFWAPRIRKNSTVTIPIAFSYCESSGRVKNFEIAGNDTIPEMRCKQGYHKGCDEEYVDQPISTALALRRER
jgi:hypothetical protein